MVTVATFERPEEAHLLRTRLESAGFEAFVQDESLVQLDMLYSYAVGGVRVQVPPEQREEAWHFLRADAGVEAWDQDSMHCPRCGWTGIEHESFSRRFAFFMLAFFSLPVPIFRGGCGAIGVF